MRQGSFSVHELNSISSFKLLHEVERDIPEDLSGHNTLLNLRDGRKVLWAQLEEFISLWKKTPESRQATLVRDREKKIMEIQEVCAPLLCTYTTNDGVILACELVSGMGGKTKTGSRRGARRYSQAASQRVSLIPLLSCSDSRTHNVCHQYITEARGSGMGCRISADVGI